MLRAEQLSLKEEVDANEELGAGVRDVVHRTAKVRVATFRVFSGQNGTKVVFQLLMTTYNVRSTGHPHAEQFQGPVNFRRRKVLPPQLRVPIILR